MAKQKTLTDWQNLPDDDVIAESAGFVYLVTNLANNRKYVGRKYFWRELNKRVAGKKRRQKVKLESEWRSYKSSSKELLSDIELYGEENFRFEILSVHKTRGEVNYAEVREQFIRDVLQSDEYYNSNILSRYFKPKEKGTEEYEKKCQNISAALKEGYQSGKIVHGLKGKPHPNRGKSIPQTGHKKNLGNVSWTDGVINVYLKEGQDPPPGFRRGLTKKPTDWAERERLYYLDPTLCQECGSPIPYIPGSGRRRGRKTCSRPCTTAHALRNREPNKGENNPMWKGRIWTTPAGDFASVAEAAEANKCSTTTIYNRCKAGKEGWGFIVEDKEK
jgi:hypothetical protein